MEKLSELKYKTLSKKLDRLVEKTFSLLSQFDKSDIASNLKTKLQENKERTELKVAFVGQYNAGKSTIISALTNNKDIEIDANVATDKSSDYTWNNIKITDTPGILAGKVEQHDITTKEALSNADLIVYVLTSQLFDDVIFENFIDLAFNQKLKDKMLIAVNKMSMEKGDFEILRKNYSESIKTVFKERNYKFDFDIVFMDAFDYIEGIDEDEEDLLEISNFNQFIDTLNSFIQQKGIIQKAFDTPIRIIQEELSQIALNETDPNFGLILKKYENRLLKHKKELIREVGYLYNNLKDKILTEGYLISSSLDQTKQEEFDSKQENFNKLLESESSETMKNIEIIVAQKNEELAEELKTINNDSDVIVYTDNLNNKFEKTKLDKKFESSSLNSKINLLDSLKGQAAKLSSFTGANKAAGVFAKSAEIAGSKGHTLVYDIGKTIGYKFKPWEAVNITKNVGNVAKFAGPAISVITAGMSIYGAVKEEKELKKVISSKNQMNNSFYEIANDIVSQIDKKFNKYVTDNVDNKLKEFTDKKIEIIEINESNSNFLNDIKELNEEYVDFIELVNE